MNNLSIFLCVVFCMISHVYGDIRIENELKFNKYLWISCFSGDDRMEPVIKKTRRTPSYLLPHQLLGDNASHVYVETRT
ncbi:hypothetical protein F2Q69_00020094 [Brassica cretica]|uniref:Uncharacterized protein n=1 Tax=Brassica cretica TaxID=69181 RepID=A0A8S9QLQ7_BRACR|nr:hypothetical protein F2Q69_00020094 [Brassica cretica]